MVRQPANAAGPVRQALQTDPQKIAQTLATLNTWILPQPKEISAGTDPFDLGQCGGIRFSGRPSAEADRMMKTLATRLTQRSQVTLSTGYGQPLTGSIALGVFADGRPAAGMTGVAAADLERVGPQGYVLNIDKHGVAIAAKDFAGLFYGMTTLVQIATDRPIIPALHVNDWPTMIYRGAQQDICRGQVPKPETLKRLADVLAEAKMNIEELYIENTFKFKSHPDISPPEGLSAEEGRDLFNYAAQSYIEVHPLFQVLGHSSGILGLPQYRKYAIPKTTGQPSTTFDIRKPETVAFMNELIDDICAAFPGTFLNVDITEIDYDGLLASGTPANQVNNLVFNYVLQLNAMVKKHNMRLAVVQSPLDSTGSLSGLGPNLNKLPREIIVGSYYCAGGPYQPAWKTDFPRLQALGFDFFAQPWIYSHTRLTPWAEAAADFSDLEVSRGLMYGAKGSTTADWGDEGHFHLAGTEWYGFTYHGACAWTGAKLNRGYFNQAFTRLFYGVPGDGVAQGILQASSVNGQKVSAKNAQGQAVRKDSDHFYEFFGNPTTQQEITSLTTPVQTGQDILGPANQAVRLLQTALTQATRNRDNLRQQLFGARCYQTMGNKLVAWGHYLDKTIPRAAAATELSNAADRFYQLQNDFCDMWTAEDRPNETYDRFVRMFNDSSSPLLTASGKSRPFIKTFKRDSDIAGAMIRWGLLGRVEKGQLVLTFNSGAPDQPGGSKWGWGPGIIFPVSGFKGDDYKEFACKVTVTNVPPAKGFNVQLSSYLPPGNDNSKHMTQFFPGTQVVRFNIPSKTTSGKWTGTAPFLYIGLDMPKGNYAFGGWEKAEIRFDWIAITNDPTFIPEGEKGLATRN